MSYKIISDSCCDYTEYADGLRWLTRVPLTITLDGREFVDTEDLDIDEFLRLMAASSNAPASACPSPGDFMEAFESEAEDIYVVTLSDKVSGSYNSAVQAVGLYAAEHPEKRIHVFNSRSAASGQVLVCVKIKELADEGLAFDEVVARAERFISSMSTFFVLETLDVFRKNGRLSHLQAFITDTMKIKLVMGAEKDGSVGMMGKALTMNSAIKKMSELAKKRMESLNIADRIVAVTHCNCLERAQKAMEAVMEATGIKKGIICRTGGISTMYANEGGIVVCL